MTADAQKELVGTWKSDPTDHAGMEAYGNVSLTFSEDGTLLYIVHQAGQDQVIRMTFTLEPGTIITDQPSEPRREKTSYQVTEDGRLVLTMSGQKSRYVRVK